MIFTVLPMLFDPCFCRLFRLDGFYINNDGTKYSIKKIKTISTDPKTQEVTVDEYFTYSEGIMNKFPGYQLDGNNLVENISDTEIDLEKHIELLLSKNSANLPDFRIQARFLTGAPF